MLNPYLSRKGWFSVSHIDILWHSVWTTLERALGFRPARLWCVPHGQFLEPQSKYLSHRATRANFGLPVFLNNTFFPGFSIIYLNHPLVSALRQMDWCKKNKTDKLSLSTVNSGNPRYIISKTSADKILREVLNKVLDLVFFMDLLTIHFLKWKPAVSFKLGPALFYTVCLMLGKQQYVFIMWVIIIE